MAARQSTVRALCSTRVAKLQWEVGGTRARPTNNDPLRRVNYRLLHLRARRPSLKLVVIGEYRTSLFPELQRPFRRTVRSR